MDIKLISNYLQEKLATVDAINHAAQAIGVSQSTMYRLKSNPRAIQLGQILNLTDAIGMPVDEAFSWLPSDFLAEERHRLANEIEVANTGGVRMSVTPFFTFHAELREVADLTAVEMYDPADWREKREATNTAREERKVLYESGGYESREIINGHLYAQVFFSRKGRYSPMSEDLRNRQIENLIKSLNQKNVQRRVYLGYDLPIITWYSTNTALLRIGEFSVEVKGAKITKSIEEVFNEYFALAHLKNKDDVENFLREPLAFLRKNEY